jgi:hypothetical protein
MSRWNLSAFAYRFREWLEGWIIDLVGPDNGNRAIIDAKGDLATIIDAKRMAHSFGHRSLALGGDRADFFD